MSNEVDRQHLSNKELAELEAMLVSCAPDSSTAVMLRIQEWKVREAAAYAARGVEIAAASAAVSKAAYHEANPGARFNKKHNHAPQDIAGGETAKDYKKRTHRDRQRSRRGVTSVRPYNPAPTPEERIKQKRAARKRSKDKIKAEKAVALAERTIV